MKILKKKRFYIFSLCLISFLIIMIAVLKNDILGIDEVGYNFIKEHLICDNLTPIVSLLTDLGGSVVLIILSLCFLFYIKDKKISYGIICNLVISVLLNLGIKILLQRERPLLNNRLIDVTGYSFPSGHAMVSMAFYGFLIYLAYVYWNNKKYKWPVICLLTFIILIIGFSRIYLGVHYLSDVLAGFLISISYLILYVYFFNIILKKGNSKE